MKEFLKPIVLLFVVFIVLGVLLTGCAKTASETATEAALKQTAVITQVIKKECPQAQINEHIASLETMIKAQLSACEVEKGQLREKNNTLLAILIGLISVIVAVKWFKIKTKVFK